MTSCTFAGHREVYQREVRESVYKRVEALMDLDDCFVFYCGGMGEFDAICAGVVRSIKKAHKDKDISLCLIEPYMKQSINREKEWLEQQYDEIIVPMELEGIHYKKAITARNRWMIDRSSILLAYVYRDFGGASDTLKYAKKKGLTVYNFAKSTEKEQ